MPTTAPILIAYDGSEDVRHAIAHAAASHPAASAVVLYVRQPLESVAAHLEGHPDLEEVRGIDEASRDAAERLAAEGAEYARSPGLHAEPQVAGSSASVADTIAAVAEELEASLIACAAAAPRIERCHAMARTMG